MTKEDIRLIRDEVGGIVPQYFNEDNQEYAVETTDGSYVTRADFNFGKTKLLRDRKGGILPQLWNPELQAFEVRTAQNGGGSGTGTQGPRGYSAYQVAIQDGFEGTQEEWLVSLKGEDGIDGKNGADGKSAYEIAVEKGFIGTESDWLASLEGETGAPGTTTWAGITDKPTEFKPEAHTHEMTDVNGLETAISTEVSKIVDSAPETLNTLNELAAALGDDPNFATTVATEIGKKADADHKHAIADVTNLQTELDKKAKQTDLNTTNSNVTDLQEDVSNLSQTVTSNHSELTEHLAEKATKTKPGHIKLQEDWINGVLQNGWTGEIKYAKNDLGLVTLVFIGTSGIVSSNTLVSLLPSDYLPQINRHIPATAVDGNVGKQGVYFYITSSGLRVNGEGITSSTYSLQISYYVD